MSPVSSIFHIELTANSWTQLHTPNFCINKIILQSLTVKYVFMHVFTRTYLHLNTTFKNMKIRFSKIWRIQIVQIRISKIWLAKGQMCPCLVSMFMFMLKICTFWKISRKPVLSERRNFDAGPSPRSIEELGTTFHSDRWSGSGFYKIPLKFWCALSLFTFRFI